MADYLVTGAGGGMGSAVCRLLAEEGHRVFGLDRAFPQEDGPFTRVRADLRVRSEVEEAFRAVSEKTEKLTGIVHAAGIYDLNSLAEMPEEDFLRDLDVNLIAAFRVDQVFLPLLKEGRIVMITSELAPLDPLPFTGVYAVTKTALDRYASALRMEVQLLGHQVSVIRPGAVKTGMLGVSTDKLRSFVQNTALYPVNAARFQRIVDRVEAKNVPPEKVAAVIRRALTVRRPKLVYTVNRNPLLLLLQALPARLRLWIIRKILA